MAPLAVIFEREPSSLLEFYHDILCTSSIIYIYIAVVETILMANLLLLLALQNMLLGEVFTFILT